MKISLVKILYGVVLTLSLLMISDCKKSNPISTPPGDGPDTTSHNFTFTKYTFGGEGGSSYFKDVAIINDNDIWCVGAIYTDSGTYNAAHWDGFTWKLIKIQFATICGQSSQTPYPTSSVFSFGSSDVWVAMDGSQIARLNGITQKTKECLPISFSISKIWGRTQDTVYVVGSKGTIMCYLNGVWFKQESGTTIDLRDVWGTSDPEGAGGKTVWACGYSNNHGQSVLLKYEETTWETVWSSNPTAPPYSGLIISLWGDQDLYLAGTGGIFRQSVTVEDSIENVLKPIHWPYQIKGSADNNIAVVGDFGMIYHYNGSTWRLINDTNLNQPLYSVAISKNIIAAVGSDYSTFPNAALIYVGKRE